MTRYRASLLSGLVLLALAASAGCGQSQEHPRVKNVIIMIADGSGFNHTEAASLYRTGHPGSEPQQQFPVRLAASTFPSGGSYDPAQFWQGIAYAKRGATDSAAAATALATGVKTRNGYLGVDAEGKPLKTAVEVAEATGKATGLLSTVPFCHATPAGFATHSSGRGDYPELAEQMLLKSGVDVLIAPGNPWYNDNGERLAKPSFSYLSEELWQGLEQGTAGGDADGDGDADPWRLVQTQADLLALRTAANPGRVFGLMPAGTTMAEGRKQPADTPARRAKPFSVPFIAGMPTLADNTVTALSILSRDPDGFFMMVEGGAVDWAAHSNFGGRMIEEQMAFGDAVAAVVKWVEAHSNWDETLLVVTADHETGCLTGPGSDPGWTPMTPRPRGQMPFMRWRSTGHTNSLVPVFARGAGSELLREYADQTDPVRGPYVDNTEIALTIHRLLR